MANISGVLSDKGRGQGFYVKDGDSFKYTVDLSNDFDGVCTLQRTLDGGISYEVVASIPSDVTDVEVSDAKGTYSIVVEYGPGEVALTGTATFSFSEVNLVLFELRNNKQEVVFSVDEKGVSIQKSSSGVGGVSASTVVANELGNGSVHKTVLTLTNVVLPVVSVTTGRGVGGVKIYDFPAGYINNLGCTAALSIAVETQGDFTDATPEGDIGIGTVAPANADALGTDATDDNFATATAFTMDSYAATANCPPEAAAIYNGSSQAIDLYVNAAIDAADIDDDVTTNLLISGTITIVWTNLGDF